MKEEELQRKREEAERKARRGEIDPTHEFTFHLIGQVGSRTFSNTLYSYVVYPNVHIKDYGGIFGAPNQTT